MLNENGPRLWKRISAAATPEIRWAALGAVSTDRLIAFPDTVSWQTKKISTKTPRAPKEDIKKPKVFVWIRVAKGRRLNRGSGWPKVPCHKDSSAGRFLLGVGAVRQALRRATTT